ncbi:MAG: hypothetical protein OQJ98_02985 [Candidatus Pacebacteria bacterium]|nr:hypothetical protein [Candidatus Paceibacterota bacterium]
MKHTPEMTQRTAGNATGDLILVVSVVLILGVIWLLSGGPTRTTDEELVKFERASEEGVLSPNFTGFFLPIQREESENYKKYRDLEEELGRTRDYGETSPHWGLVTIEHSTGGMKNTSPEEEYLVLNTSYKLGDPISITGWELQSMTTNKAAVIGQATQVSTSGNINIESSVVISAHDRLYITTGQPPTGYSFRVNKCSGYFEQFQDFTPTLSKQCPYAKDELMFADDDPYLFGSECLNYIERLPRCIMPLEALPIGFPNSCALFITEKINYNTCVKNHRDDADFLEDEWRIFLKQSDELWEDRDIIRLLDENGKVVDVFSY